MPLQEARVILGRAGRRTEATIADPSDEEHEEHEGMLEWLALEDPWDFDPAAFDLIGVNARLHGHV